MKLPEIAIRNPVFTWMIMAALIIFGAISFQRMGVSQLPDVDFPYVNVSVSFEGAAPEVMESTVVDPLEDALMSLEGIRGLSSRARAGNASISIEFDLDKDIDVAVQEVQTRIGQAQRRLPDEIDPPVISKSNPEDQPIMWLSVRTTNMSTKDFMLYVRNHVRDRFTTIPGVSEVTLGGYLEPALRVWVSAEKLNRYSLTVDDIIQTISAEHAEPPAGRIETGEKEFNVRTLGEAVTAEEFGKININRRGGSPNFNPIFLNEVATVEDGLEDVRRISRTRGESSIGIGIRKQRGANAVQIAKFVKERMEEVKKDLPEGTTIQVNFDLTQFIEESVHELNFHLVLAGILTSIVCWIFLGSFTATLNVIMAIPTSIVGSFIVLYALGFTLNTFTLLGLSLAIGIVVDDAIMVLENIFRHREMRKNKSQAARDGAVEITFAAMAATAAIVAIFLPVAFMEGIIGRYFFQFGVTISVAVMLSLLEALTLTPMRSAAFLKVEERTTKFGKMTEKAFLWLEGKYEAILPKILKYRWTTIGVSLLFFTASMYLLVVLKKEMVPAQDQSRFMIRVMTPEGSSIEYTDEKFKEIEKILASKKEILSYFVSVGGFGGGQVNTGMSFVTLVPASERDVTQQEFMNLLREELKQIKGARALLSDPSQSGFGARRSSPVEFSVRGADWQKLGEYAEILKNKLEEEGVMADADTDYRADMPEIHVIPDRDRAKLHGVSLSDIGRTINALIAGSAVGKFTRDGRRYDIRIRLQQSERNHIDDIKKLFVRNNRGELIRLSDVVKIEERKSLQSINREERQRAVSVYGNVGPNSSQGAAIDRVQSLAREILPAGYNVVIGGSSQVFQESFYSLIFALILGVVVAYMVLASQFNSFLDPITVLLALPFSASGALIFLWLRGQTINIYSMIGLLLLMGIVKKNSILLVDFANQKMKEGLNKDQAMLKAAPIRLRPILMTSFATIAAALPQAIAVGPGSEARSPMALSIVGGVLVSTFLTMFVVPSFYSLFKKKPRAEVTHLKSELSHYEV